jgi:hypothetical protein
MPVRGEGHQTAILDRTSDRKVIEGLQAESLDGHNLMYGVVEKAADPGRPDPGRFGFEIQDLSQQTRLPEHPWIPPGSSSSQLALKFGKHGE